MRARAGQSGPFAGSNAVLFSIIHSLTRGCRGLTHESVRHCFQETVARGTRSSPRKHPRGLAAPGPAQSGRPDAGSGAQCRCTTQALKSKRMQRVWWGRGTCSQEDRTGGHVSAKAGAEVQEEGPGWSILLKT